MSGASPAAKWEQFELPWAPVVDLRPTAVRYEWRLERIPTDPRMGERLYEYKQLAREGWSVSALLAPDSKTVVLIGCKEEK